MNKKTAGVSRKLLATVAVFAMVAAAFAVVGVADESAAAPVEDNLGPIDFENAVDENDKTNAALGNNIIVSYDAEDKTYYISGTLGKLADITVKIDDADVVFNYKVVYSDGVESKNLYVYSDKATDRTVVTIDNVEYDIDVSGVEKSDKAQDPGYTVVENSNALADDVVSGTDGADGKWALADGVLTLTNYNGKEFFAGNYSKIVLVGENTVTLKDARCAFVAYEANDAEEVPMSALEIMSVDGQGKLSVSMDITDVDLDKVAAIMSADLDVNGITLDVAITDSAEREENTFHLVAGIVAQGKAEFYEAGVTMTVDEDNYDGSFGILAESIDIKSCENFSVAAGKIAILALNNEVDEDGNIICGFVNIAASNVKAVASTFAVATNGTLTVTKASNVDARADGFGDDSEFSVGTVVKSIITQSDSVFTSNGMYIGGADSVNNATVTNTGDMVIAENAKYVNMSVFNNNGTIGIYGTFENAAGTTTNNGKMNSYGFIPAEGSSIAFDVKEDTISVPVEIYLIAGLADGTCKVAVDVDGTTIFGTMTYKDGKYAVEASSDDLTFTLEADAEKKDVYVAYVNGSLEDSTPIEAEAEVAASLFNDMFTAIGSTVVVKGGLFDNAENAVVSIDSNNVVKLVDGADAKFLNNGTLEIAVDLEINGAISGNDVTVPADKSVKLTGNVDMTFLFSGEYKNSDDSKKNYAYDNAVKVSGDVSALVIKAVKADAKNNAPFMLAGNVDAAVAKTATVSIVKGTLVLNGVTVGEGMVVEALAGATITVDKDSNSTKGVVAVQDGATINMKIKGDRDTSKFGTLEYIISFNNNGYTYYGSLQYALTNAAEGAELTLNHADTVDNTTDAVKTVTVKKGITLKFNEKIELTLDNITLVMEEGAKFVLADGAKIVLNDVILTGTVVYDVNEVAFKDFAVVGEANITEKAAKKSAASSIVLNGINANAGELTAVKGEVDGNVVLFKVTETGDDKKLKSVANVTVAQGAVLNANILEDDNNDKSVFTVDGVFNLSSDKTYKGTFAGAGKIVLADKVSVTFVKAANVNLAVANTADSAIEFNDAAFNAKSKIDGQIAVKAMAKSGSAAAYLAVSGVIYSGEAVVTGNAVANALTVQKDAKLKVPAGAVLSIKDDVKSVATGLVMVAGTLNLETEDNDKYGALDYQITYKSGEFTVYTQLSTGVNNGQPGDEFTVDKKLPITENINIPAGVTIIVNEKARIVVADDVYITVGTPITALGATTSGIQGTVELADKAFLVVYNDAGVDMSKAKVVVKEDDKDKAAKNSCYTLKFNEYATVFVGSSTAAVDSAVKEVLVPAIDGYRFLGWNALVINKVVGETDFEGLLKADKVQVIFEKVEGVKYYVNGNLMNTVGAPVVVDYGSTVTAVADYGYKGDAKVNGQDYLKVTSDLKTVTGSGVSVIEPTPVTPVEPTEKDDGMDVTDYLLIVLVVLTAILAIMVVARMMRS